MFIDIINMWNFFGKKKGVDVLRTEVRESFDNVKNDFNKIGKWIVHLDDKTQSDEYNISEIKKQILDIQNDILEIKDFVSFFGPQLSNGSSKQIKTGVVKQTAPRAVQTAVQTGVQTGVLDNLTVMERAIVWTLLNSELKLSYEDLAALLGKDKSTIRGQINTIKQKSDGLILEYMEVGGKKRLYIPYEIKSAIIKSVKISVKVSKNHKKSKSEG